MNFDELSRLIDDLWIDTPPAWAEGRIHEPPSAEFIAEVLVNLYEAGQDAEPVSGLAEVLALSVSNKADRGRLVELTVEAIEPILGRVRNEH